MRHSLRPKPAAPPGSGETAQPDAIAGAARRARIRLFAKPEARQARLVALGEAVPTIEGKRRAAREIAKAFRRIEADFSEAYEQCRTDAQRRAIEEAHRAARSAVLRARREARDDDRAGWQRARAEFGAALAAAERRLAALEGAGAVLRILRRLAAIHLQLAVLAV